MAKNSGPDGPADLLSNGGSSSRSNEYGGSHESIFDRDRGSHISWDTNQDGDYVHGSGHTREHGSNSRTSWDR